MSNPYQHSKLAVVIYETIHKQGLPLDQEQEGTLAISISEAVAFFSDAQLRDCTNRIRANRIKARRAQHRK